MLSKWTCHLPWYINVTRFLCQISQSVHGPSTTWWRGRIWETKGKNLLTSLVKLDKTWCRIWPCTRPGGSYILTGHWPSLDQNLAKSLFQSYTLPYDDIPTQNTGQWQKWITVLYLLFIIFICLITHLMSSLSTLLSNFMPLKHFVNHKVENCQSLHIHAQQ